MLCDSIIQNHPFSVLAYIQKALNDSNQITFISICGSHNKIDLPIRSDQDFGLRLIQQLSQVTLFWKCSIIEAIGLFPDS